MATPVGHVLAGAATGALMLPSERLRARLAAGGLAGGAADLDFLPGIVLGDPARFHHSFSHSLAFSLLALVVVVAIVRRKRIHWGVLAASAYTTHLLLDYLTADPSPPEGIPILWPLLETAFESPITVLPRVLHSSASAINLHNFLVAGTELAVFGGLLALVLAFRHRRGLEHAVREGYDR